MRIGVHVELRGHRCLPARRAGSWAVCQQHQRVGPRPDRASILQGDQVSPKGTAQNAVAMRCDSGSGPSSHDGDGRVVQRLGMAVPRCRPRVKV